MKFIMEFDDLTYEEIINRLRMIADKMDTEHKCPSSISTGERYYILPSKRDFDEWEKEEQNNRGDQG
jgi:hypothetical protein